MRSLYVFTAMILAAQLFLSCESEADVDLGESVPTLVVDAFVNDLPEEQRIVLNFSQPFFDNTIYRPASGASVLISNDQNDDVIVFVETPPASGIYTWTSGEDGGLGMIGATYLLTIDYDGKTYQSANTLGRTTTIDSILFFEEEGIFGGDDFIEGRFYAIDPVGVGDTYWFKTFKNDTFLNRPPELNVAYDGGFDPGADLDGITFIPPIRNNINPIPPDDDDDDEGYEIGDRVRVEAHSISNDTHLFLGLLQEQTDRPGGFAELFATPLANLPTNITVQVDDPNERVLGRFSVSAVERLEVTFTEDLLRSDD